MDFRLSPDQELLRDTARRLAAAACPASLLRAHLDDPRASDPLDARLRDLAGVAAADCTDLVLVLQELGYVAAPGTFVPTVALAAPMLTAAGHEALDALAAGERTATLALAGANGRWSANAEPVKTFVAEADRVDLVVVVDAGPTVRILTSPPARQVHTVDSTRRVFEVDTSDGGAEVVTCDPAALDHALTRATVAVAAELVGTARRLLDMTLAYVKERHQFGVPIGSFQAVQHKAADMALAVERAGAAVAYAAMTLDAADADRRRAAHVAKAAANAAATRAAKDAIQLHGGIGYTWEHDLHLFLRRAYGSAAWLGTTDDHHDALANLLI